MKRLLTHRMLVVLPVLAAAFAVTAAAQASTIGQLQALGAAKVYLSSGHFSRAGLIDQLESPYGEDFSHSDAVWGVNHAHANWNAEAVQAARRTCARATSRAVPSSPSSNPRTVSTSRTPRLCTA